MARTDLNQVMLIGRLTKDPELRQTGAGRSVATFSLATNDSYKDASGVMQERTEFTDIVAWAKPGEIIAQYSKKGDQLFVSGRLQTRTWQAQDGTNRKTTEVVLREFQFLGKSGGGAGGTSSFSAAEGSQAAPSDEDFSQDPLAGTEGTSERGRVDVKDLPF